ncbi:MAG TPA: hypothetical protein VLE97_09125 [Gaiellaceae bacterium]|nr:hypothetical protein [Gaiellaceae bacterium]
MATTKKTTKKKTTKPKAAEPPRKSKRTAAPTREPSEQTRPRETSIARTPPRFEHGSRLPPSLPRGQAASSVTVANEAEALFYFARIDQRLADAWKRDVVVPEGPITIHKVVGSFFDATHYAYVDRRLIWYLRHDPSDPLGAKWEGYLKSAADAPRGTTVSFVGRDIVAKKCPPQLAKGSS